MGRPSKLTADVQSRVCEALALGVSIEAAAAHAGIGTATHHEWCVRGRDGEAPYAEYLDATTRARDSAEVRYAAVVARAAKDGHVGAAQWWLERRRSAQWGRAQVSDAAADGEHAPPAVDVAPLLERLARSVESRTGST